MANKNCNFAPLPVRALSDKELNGGDIKVLAAISSYDRFGANGTGCYASLATLSKMTNLKKPTISTKRRKLVKKGYLHRIKSGRGKAMYRVIHDESELHDQSAHRGGEGSPDASLYTDRSGAKVSAGAETNISSKTERYSGEPIPQEDNANNGVISPNDRSMSQSGELTDQMIDQLFEEQFWPAYPKRVAKLKAKRIFRSLMRDSHNHEDLINRMISALELHKKTRQWTKEDGQYIPHPATWLEQGRWEDIIPESEFNTDKYSQSSDLVTARIR